MWWNTSLSAGEFLCDAHSHHIFWKRMHGEEQYSVFVKNCRHISILVTFLGPLLLWQQTPIGIHLMVLCPLELHWHEKVTPGGCNKIRINRTIIDQWSVPAELLGCWCRMTAPPWGRCGRLYLQTVQLLQSKRRSERSSDFAY